MQIDIKYDQFYYEKMNSVQHPHGYTSYERYFISYSNDPEDQGEWFKTQHFKIFNKYREQLFGKKVLDMGCAKGFFTEDVNEFGAQCIGIDKSEWAISKSNESCQVKDVRTFLPTLPDNAFDTIVGMRLLPCLKDEEIQQLLPHILRVAQNRIFIVDDKDSYETPEGLLIASWGYNIKTIDEWRAMLPGCIIESVSEVKLAGR